MHSSPVCPYLTIHATRAIGFAFLAPVILAGTDPATRVCLIGNTSESTVMSSTVKARHAANAGTVSFGGITVNRLGFGAMRITGEGIWGEPKDPAEAKRVLRRAVELGVNLIDTADSYGPEVSERLIGETLA